MVNSRLGLNYDLFFGENDSRAKGLLSNGKKYSVDGLNIHKVIDFLSENNFRVMLDDSKKDSEIWERRGLEQTVVGVPIDSSFGKLHREEVRKYSLPAINNGKYPNLKETKYNKVNLTIIDSEYAKMTNGRKDGLIWRLEFTDQVPCMKDAARMVHEFEDVAYAIHGMRDILERIREDRFLAKR